MTEPKRISNREEDTLRVVVHQFYDNGLVTAEAFSPTKNDQFHLSVSRQSVISAGEALQSKADIIRERKQKENKPFVSPPAVACVSVGEIEDIPLPAEDGELVATDETALSVWDDSMMPDVPHHHGYVDFEKTYEPRKRRKAVTKRLAYLANNNGKLYLGSSDQE